MKTFKFWVGAGLALSIGGAAHAADLGACAWESLPAADRSQLIAANQRDAATAGAALKAMDREIRTAATACGARSDLPVRWIRTATAAEALQASMADALQSARGLDRRRLDEVWDEAAPDIKDCVRVSAAKTLRLTPPACLHSGAALLLAQQLGIPITTAQHATVSHALLYYYAKGHTEYVNALIQEFNRRG